MIELIGKGKQMMKKERWPLESTYNTRDLGGYPLPDGKVSCDHMLRSDYFQPISAKDAAYLKEKGLNLVIDLRDEKELERLPSVFAGDPDVDYVHISLIPPDDVRELGAGIGDQGDYLFMMGDAYIYALDERKEIYRAMLKHPEGKTFFHCSAGKDRTGVVAALLLLLAGAAEKDVVEDYALTSQFLAPVLPLMMEDFRKAGGVDDKVLEAMFASPPENMERTIAYLEENYGGAENYFQQLGLTEDEIEALRSLMMC